MGCSIQRGGVEFNWTFHLSTNEHNSHYCTNEKHSLFVVYNIQVDLFFSILIGGYKFQNKQSVCFETRKHLNMCFAVYTAALPKTRTQWCFYSLCNSTFRMERKMRRWVTQRAIVLLFAITWRTSLHLLGCYIKCFIHPKGVSKRFQHAISPNSS